MGCLNEKEQAGTKCFYCGFEEELSPNEPNQLSLWTILKGKYVVGKALGEGGFGITYIGMDLNLQLKVAIKEFFPFGYAVRKAVGDPQVCHLGGERGKFFLQEKEKFVEEARTLAQLDEQPGVVKVRDYFEANGTAYIVMEFLEGKTLKQYMNEYGGKIPEKEVLMLMEPVIKSMAGIHDKNVIHRDISLDNIMLTNKGKVKLLDFGAALSTRGRMDDNVILYKEGYSPLEQVTGEGELGTYSDIYAFCATMYYAITGILPPNPQKRAERECLKSFEECGVKGNPLVEAAIMYGMELQPENRIKNATDLYYFLYVYGKSEKASASDMKKKIRESSTKVIVDKIRKENQQKQRRTFVLAVAGILLVIGVLIISLKTHSEIAQKENQPMVAEISNNIDNEENKITEEDLQTVKEELYQLVEHYRSENNSFEVNKKQELEQMATALATKCITNNFATSQEWNQAISQYVTEVKTKYQADSVGWLVLPYAANHSVGQVLEDANNNIASINAGVENALDLLSCSELGIGVGIHTDGTWFWVIFYQ